MRVQRFTVQGLGAMEAPTSLSQLKKQVVHPAVLDINISIFADQAEGLPCDGEIPVFEEVIRRDIPRDHDGKRAISVTDGFLERGQDAPFLGVGQPRMKNKPVHLKIFVLILHRVGKAIYQLLHVTHPPEMPGLRRLPAPLKKRSSEPVPLPRNTA